MSEVVFVSSARVIRSVPRPGTIDEGVSFARSASVEMYTDGRFIVVVDVMTPDTRVVIPMTNVASWSQAMEPTIPVRPEVVRPLDDLILISEARVVHPVCDDDTWRTTLSRQTGQQLCTDGRFLVAVSVSRPQGEPIMIPMTNVAYLTQSPDLQAPVRTSSGEPSTPSAAPNEASAPPAPAGEPAPVASVAADVPPAPAPVRGWPKGKPRGPRKPRVVDPTPTPTG